jgi:hypothetical protein
MQGIPRTATISERIFAHGRKTNGAKWRGYYALVALQQAQPDVHEVTPYGYDLANSG